MKTSSSQSAAFERGISTKQLTCMLLVCLCQTKTVHKQKKYILCCAGVKSMASSQNVQPLEGKCLPYLVIHTLGGCMISSMDRLIYHNSCVLNKYDDLMCLKFGLLWI